MKINSRIKLIALAVSMIVSFGAVAAPEANVSNESVKQQEKGQYIVRQGETVAHIAARIRPANMSLKETIRALVKANPKVFRNGNINFIRVGDVLVIPAALESSKADNQAAGNEKAVTPADHTDATQAKPTQQVKPTEQPKAVKPIKELEIASDKAKATGEKKSETNVEQSKANATDGKEQKQDDVSASAPNSAGHEAASSVSAEASNVGYEEKSSSSLIWIILAAIGLLALFIFNKMKGAKQEAGVVDTNEAEPVEKAAVNVEIAVAQSAKEEDGLFFNDVEEAKTPEEAPAGNVDIDLSSLDDQVGIVSSAVTNDEETNKRRDANWDEIESTDSIYEEEPKSASVENNDVVEVDVVEAEEIQSATAEEHQDAPLEFDLSEDSTESKTETAHVEEPVAEEEVASVGQEQEPSVVEVAAEEEKVEEPAQTEPAVEEATLEPEAVEENIAEPEVVETQQAPVQAPEPVIEEVDSKESAEELDQSAFASVQDNTEEREDFLDTHITEAGDDTVIEWDSVQIDGNNEEVGFVSESVGMTAPLEAKYELAQMYIEIGDPEAARETLNELVEEASGDILAKSKALLAELG